MQGSINVAIIIVVILLLIILLYGDTIQLVGAIISVIISIILQYTNSNTNANTVVGGSGKQHLKDNFPYKKYFISKDRIPTMLKNIGSQKYISGPKDMILAPAPQLLELVRLPGIYDEADVIGDLFTEEARMKANVDRHVSPAKFWRNREIAIRLEAKKRFPDKYNENDTDPTGKNAYALRETIYQLNKEANQFSPSSAAAIYKMVSTYLGRPIEILDPFAGWGDRMIAAVSLPEYVKSYFGIDANNQLRHGYTEIAKLTLVQEQKPEIKFEIADSLRYFKKQKEQKLYDLIFTSPPYYDYETYSHDEKQSIHGKTSYKHWLDAFYKPVLHELVQLLKPDGFFIIHVGPTYSAPTFDTDTKQILNNENLQFYNTIYFGKKDKKAVPAFIYRMEVHTIKQSRGGCRMPLE